MAFKNKESLIEILKVNENLSHIKDVDSLLSRVLSEARRITKADAGTIFLVKENKLSFEYVQNATLMKDRQSTSRYLYTKQQIDINNRSIAGYVALNKKSLIIDDVYQMDGSLPYNFNRSFDESSSYHTQSVLTVPLITRQEKVIGIIQIINAKNGKGKIIPFTREDEYLVFLFANQAAIAIERAQMTREIILRMIRIAELRDPEETGTHVNRVGAYSIEIYQHWAYKNNIPEKEIEKVKDILRIAAMLHDVGKVAISDSILKKKSRLSKKEYHFMKMHTVHGAKLFKDSNSDWDDMAAEIALNHHEKWDGSGYPGYLDDLSCDTVSFGTGKKGRDIPLTARIVALADVYDALMSFRSYKDEWPEERVLAYIESQKNKHFDPELVDTFMEIYDVIRAIYNKYS